MQKTDFIILWHSTVHKKNITILTFKSKKRTADTYTRTVLLLPKSTQHWHYCFLLIFDKLEHQLGTYDFLTLFNTILTDRGSEFGDPDSLETGTDGMIRSSIYFCDPMRSGQKGGIEQAHTMLRMILPKKNSFEFLTQWDLRTIVDHINSTPREILGGRTPYDVALENYGIDILKALQLRPIPPDEVNLTPKLIRFNR